MSESLGLSGSPTQLESEEITIAAVPDGPSLSIYGTTVNSDDDRDETTPTTGDGDQMVGSPRCRLEGAGANHSSQ